MNDHLAMNRRAVLRALGAAGAAAAWPALGRAAEASEGAAFDASVARAPLLVPFKGISDGGTAGGDLRCAALAVTGRWPAGLRGRFYRNGPALFERAGQRYHHWFDGDGMVQQFTFSERGVSHVGRLVRTPKLAAEHDAGRFLFPTFGTPIASDAPIQGPDSINVANTNAIEHAGRVLALWEGGSAFALDPNDLATQGPVTWKEGFEQVPFSAHPKVDASGHLWNIGSFADKLVVWHIDPAGRLVSAQIGASPYPNGMVHDVAITARHIVVPLPPVKLNFAAIAKGASAEQAFVFERDQPLRILVMQQGRHRRAPHLRAAGADGLPRRQRLRASRRQHRAQLRRRGRRRVPRPRRGRPRRRSRRQRQRRARCSRRCSTCRAAAPASRR